MLNDEHSLSELLNALKKFSTWSGLEINKRKSKIISPKKISLGQTDIQGIALPSKEKILGLWIGLDHSETTAYKWNFRGILEKLQKICDSWHHRNLSLKGKVTVANSLLISLLQYPCSILFTPARVYKEYRNIISQNIISMETNIISWNNRKPRVSYKVLIQPVARGGLKLFDLETRVKASLLQWIKRTITKPHTNVNVTLQSLLDTDNLTRTLAYRAPSLPTLLKNHSFYYHMIKFYLSLHNDEPYDEDSIRREKLWFNPQVGPRGAPLHWPRWEKAGISTVGDICHHSEGRLLSHVEIADRFNIRCTFLEALSL